jgi:hypothetical protein
VQTVAVSRRRICELAMGGAMLIGDAIAGL